MDLKLISLFIFITLILNITTNSSFYDSNTLGFNSKFYNKIKKYSNGKVEIQYTREKGFYCIAGDHIKQGQNLFKIPQEYVISPLNIFPFKFEIYSFIKVVQAYTPIPDANIGFILLAYNILYEKYQNKNEIEEYLIKNNLKHYIDENINYNNETIKSFSKYQISMFEIDKEHEALLAAKGYPMENKQEINNIFNSIIKAASSSKHFDIIYTYISNFDDFLWAFNIARGKVFFITLNEYYTLKDLNPSDVSKNIKSMNITKIERKNLEINKVIGQNIPILIPFIRECKHYQPKTTDMKDKKQISILTEKGYYLPIPNFNLSPGEEIKLTYHPDPNNINLFFNNGIVIRENKFNIARFFVKENRKLNEAQFNICRDIGCLDLNIRSNKEIPEMIIRNVNYNSFDPNMLYYSKIKYLSSNFDTKQIKRALLHNEIISTDNEIKAWLFYFKSLYLNMKEGNKPIIDILRKIQKYQKILNNLDNNDFTDKGIKERKRNLIFNMIYEMDLSYRLILYRHMAYSQGQILKNINNDFQNLKNSYISS
jgi:hypothetical protein